MSSSRSRSSSPKRHRVVLLSDEDYVDEIKHHNKRGLTEHWSPYKELYVVIQDAYPDHYGEISGLYSAVPINRLQIIALTCLCTSQRQISLLGQRQTKRIAQLLFASILFDEPQKSAYDKILPIEKEWFKNLFPGNDTPWDPWTTLNWKNEMNELSHLNGYLHPIPIILHPEFYKLD
jgi:hypothetical protein